MRYLLLPICGALRVAVLEHETRKKSTAEETLEANLRVYDQQMQAPRGLFLYL